MAKKIPVKARKSNKQEKISSVLPTDEVYSNRGGLLFYSRYVTATGMLSRLQEQFGSLRKNAKGLAIDQLALQLLCFFMDGTSRHITWFDHLKHKEPGYKAMIGTTFLASSHTIKRFFGCFNEHHAPQFRKVLRDMFLDRLEKSKVNIILLGLDSMVLDNDDAEKREGVQCTYKKVKGYHPLQLNWGNMLVDALFRSGAKHSNHETDAYDMLETIIKRIRSVASLAHLPIIVRMDAGFFDKKILDMLEHYNVGYLCGGKLSESLINTAYAIPEWQTFTKRKNGKTQWKYVAFPNTFSKSKQERRVFYSRLFAKHDGQLYVELDGIGDDHCFITNIGLGETIDQLLKEGNQEHLVDDADNLFDLYHGRGADELANRALKDFGHEQLPFKHFHANEAWYYLMVLGNNLFEVFKQDVCDSVISISMYASTFRRQMIDVAAKVVRHAGKLVMKVSRAVYENLNMEILFTKAADKLHVMQQ
jgi:hypothetical protein